MHTVSKSRRTVGAGLLLLGLICGAAPVPPTSAAASLPAATNAAPSVTIDNFSFNPATLTVPRGTRVVFTNRDDIPHTVTSALAPPPFRSPPLDTGDTFAFVFDKPGTFAYFCSLHPHMQGKIVVK